MIKRHLWEHNITCRYVLKTLNSLKTLKVIYLWLGMFFNYFVCRNRYGYIKSFIFSKNRNKEAWTIYDVY